MRVYIAEKPSVGRDIARLVGATDRRDGFIAGPDVAVTWTVGHLCELKSPADYTDMWRRWSMGALPMIPQRFGIRLKDNAGLKRQFNVIKSLIDRADVVINCGDAGQEGELIQRWVMQLAQTKCPVMRLWISSLTDEAIRHGLENLKPSSEYDSLYHAGLSRAIGDWILGMNATRAYSLKYSEPGCVLSIGRVQTPTLSLIVTRQQEIENFKPETYWELQTTYRNITFSYTGDRFTSEEECAAICNKLRRQQFIVTVVEKKNSREAPPRLFDLTSLQVECNKRFGWSADRTLQLIQSLYEKKTTTYPRVDTTYLPDDIYPRIPEILRRMTPYATIVAPVLNDKIPKSKKVFNSTKVTDHHAIIPTGESPTSLSGDEKILYHLIARRFIAAFYPDCELAVTSVDGSVDDITFKASGKTILKPGWKAIYQSDESSKKTGDDKEQIMPPFVVGECGPHTPTPSKRTTQPPKYFTEGTLLRAMETAGRTVEDEELREAMKENGIGRPSTRAAIIETLFQRGYIARQGKSLRATQGGIALIQTIKDPILKSAKLTGIWENKLRQIERNCYSPATFVEELKQMIGKVVLDVMADNTAIKISTISHKSQSSKDSSESKSGSDQTVAKTRKRTTKYEQITCPTCGKGHVVKGRTAFGCSDYAHGCRWILPFTIVPSDTTPGKLNTYIKKNGSS